MFYGNSTKLVKRTLTLSLSTDIYADNDVLAATQELEEAMRLEGGVGVLRAIKVQDDDDQAQPLNIYFFESNVSLGTENDAINISDANAAYITAVVKVAGTDYYDHINSQMAYVNSLAIPLKAPDQSKSIYVGAVSKGTGTYTAAGIKLTFWIEQV